jgi:hypothetical protein
VKLDSAAVKALEDGGVGAVRPDAGPPLAAPSEYSAEVLADSPLMYWRLGSSAAGGGAEGPKSLEEWRDLLWRPPAEPRGVEYGHAAHDAAEDFLNLNAIARATQRLPRAGRHVHVSGRQSGKTKRGAGTGQRPRPLQQLLQPQQAPSASWTWQARGRGRGRGGRRP